LAGWTLLVYRVPTEPASRRVSVWRQLKRMGALYIQQCVCLLPARADLEAELNRRAAGIRELGGDYTLFDIPALRPGDDERITKLFQDLRNKEYDEIIEECETKFVKEIEFERFRENYTYAETEEIRQDLDKIRRWFKRVAERDWFGADHRPLAEEWIARCDDLLNDFEQDVYLRQSLDVSSEIDLGPLRTPSMDLNNRDRLDEELEP
jgi:hypothetical protein